MNLKYEISNENVNMILYYFRLLITNYGTYYICRKLSTDTVDGFKRGYIVLSIIIGTVIELWTMIQAGFACGIVAIILFFTIIFNKYVFYKSNNSIVMTVLGLGISNIICFISTAISGILNLILKLKNDYIALIFIGVVYVWIISIFMNINKIKNGLIFLNKKFQSEFFEFLMLELGSTILLGIIILKNSELIMQTMQIVFAIAILSIITFLTIQKSFQVYYKQKLLIQELNETKKDLKNKTEEVQKLEQENLNFSKKSHSLAHKQKSLEYKLNQLLLTTEISDEKDLKEQIQKVSKELYSKPIIELDKTGITQIDDMLNFMQSECIKNNIDFNLQLSGNIYHIINNIITEEELEILLADHIKDAIIAIKHTDNVNKSILVRLGKIEDCYGLYIYDSGIEFEKETLKNLGKKPSTTHKDEGGTGMGFMNTFDTLRKCKGSLIINEIGKPSKENYTKVIMIKFNNKNEFKVVSYKENNN